MTRADLSAGQQAAQALHAAIEQALDHPDGMAHWREISNRIVMLAVHDEQALQSVVAKLQSRHIQHTAFREPYYGDALTAVAIRPIGLGIAGDACVCEVTKGLSLALGRAPP